ncbi:MAG: DNA alkylation repair protein [Clostridia bacterium]|nr:DNA alkylation repair protein [Clostridia bacterium]
MNEIINKLFSFQDLGYKDFHSKLMPTVDKERVIGVRVPVLRKYAKELFKSGNYANFLKDLPHYYYEENNLHAFIIEQIKDYNLCILEVERFLPYIDNWATCDMLTPKCFNKNKLDLYNKIKNWINSNNAYTVRYAVKTLMAFYLDSDFSLEHLDLIQSIKSDKYYVKMAIAWYMATALTKQYDSAIKVIKSNSLDDWTHNKSIQKAVESYRIDNETKKYLKGYKRRISMLTATHFDFNNQQG